MTMACTTVSEVVLLIQSRMRFLADGVFSRPMNVARFCWSGLTGRGYCGCIFQWGMTELEFFADGLT